MKRTLLLWPLGLALSSLLITREGFAAKKTFNGAYMGLTIGGSYTNHNIEIKQGNNAARDSKKSHTSLPIGFHIGTGTTKKNKLYLGAEAGVEYDMASAAKLDNPPGLTIDGRTTIRRTFVLGAAGKIGFNMGNFLPYATLGVVANSWKVSIPAYSQSNTKILPGLGLGGGLAYQMGKHFMMGGEYRYVISQKQKFTLSNPLEQTKVTHTAPMHDLRIKLSFIP
jgi:opacity protein-like surface antigen